MTNSKKLTESDLALFCGSDKFYRSGLGIMFTDGIKYLADRTSCYWLIDVVGSYQVAGLPSFLIWELTCNPEGGAIVTAKEDSDQPDLITQEIPVTDYLDHSEINPLKLYLVDRVLMLPGEY